MELEKEYKGHLKWKHGAKQTLIARKGETFQDAIKFMRDHIKFFGYENEFTFNENDIIKGKGEFIVTLISKPKNKNIIRPGIAPELEAASKK